MRKRIRRIQWIKNVQSAPLRENADLRWTMPSGNGPVFLRGILIPQSGKDTLLCGDVFGVRCNSDKDKKRTVRKVVWNYVPHQMGKNVLKSCFSSVFEHRKDGFDFQILSAARLKPKFVDDAGAVLVEDNNGFNLCLSGSGAARNLFFSPFGEVVFRGNAAVLSFDKSKTLRKAISWGATEFSLNGKTLPPGGVISGKLTAYPDGMEEFLSKEKAAKIEVDANIPDSLCGSWMAIRLRNGGTDNYRIEKVRRSSKGSRLTLDRPARYQILIVRKDKQENSVRIVSGGHTKAGDAVRIRDHFYRVKSVFGIEGTAERRPSTGFVVDGTLPELPENQNIRAVISEMGKDDPFTIAVTK